MNYIDSPTQLAELLHSARKQQHLSREELAGLANVSTSFIRDAELDAAKCSFGKLSSLMQALGLKWQLKQPQTSSSAK